MSGSNKFDYKKPYQSGEDFDSFIQETEYHLRNRIDAKKGNSGVIAFISIASICLLSVGGYVYWQSNQNPTQVASGQLKQVAGVQENLNQGTFSGDSFSVLLKTPTPKGFQAEKKSVDFLNIQRKKGTENTFYSIQDNADKKITNSISVVSSEYDDKYNLAQFSETVIRALGADYETKPGEIMIPKNIRVVKIQKKTDPKNVAYFAALTNDNYYLIKIINESKDVPELVEYTKFTDSFLENLYLN
jgi:hypothetical protein